MFLWRYESSGCPNFERSSGQMTTVKSSFGYGFPRFRKVGFEREVERYRLEATTPQTVAFSPICCPACEAGIFLLPCPDAATARNPVHRIIPSNDLRVISTSERHILSSKKPDSMALGPPRETEAEFAKTVALLLNPNLNPTVLLSTFVGVIGSHWKIRAESSHDTWFKATLHELVFHGSGSIQRQRSVSFRCTGAIRKTEEQYLIPCILKVCNEVDDTIYVHD